MKESYIENYCVKHAKKLGYEVFKIKFISKNGAPDRFFVKENKCFFVEFKNNKGVVSSIQKYQQDILKKGGLEVHNIYDIESFKKIC